MRKKIILILLIGITVPQLTLAAWWDLSTWFKKNVYPQAIPTTVIENIPFSPQGSTSLVQPDPVVIERETTKEVIKKVPVEKIVEKIVTVQDQSLVSENILLKKTISELQLKNNQCYNTQRDIDGLEAETKKAKEELAKYIKDAEEKTKSAEFRKKIILSEIAQIELDLTRAQIEFDNCRVKECENRYNALKLQSLMVKKAELHLELSKL